MSEPPTTKEPAEVTPEKNREPSGNKKSLRPDLREKLRQRKPMRDYGGWIVLSSLSFLGFMLLYFVYTEMQSSRPVHTEIIRPKPPMYPVDKLLSATQVKLLDQEGGRAEITYAFATTAANRLQLEKVLKDWRGARNNLDQMRVRGREHESILVDSDSGLPMTPFLSAVSFDGNLDFTVQFKAVRKGRLWFFFHYIYDYEVTGTALLLEPDGVAQFVRYRRELTFDNPQGEPGRFEIKPGTLQRLRIVVKEFPLRAGFHCVAYDGESKLTEADFPPEWGDDRRYHPVDTSRRLVADFPQPPQAGFLAFISDPARAVRLDEIRITGTVAEAWRAERTKAKMILEDLLQPASVEKQDDAAGQADSQDTGAPDKPPSVTP